MEASKTFLTEWLTILKAESWERCCGEVGLLFWIESRLLRSVYSAKLVAGKLEEA